MATRRADLVPLDDDRAEFAEIAVADQREGAVAQRDANGSGGIGGEHDVVGDADETNGDAELAFDGLIAALQEPENGGEEQKKQKREELPVPQTGPAVLHEEQIESFDSAHSVL